MQKKQKVFICMALQTNLTCMEMRSRQQHIFTFVHYTNTEMYKLKVLKPGVNHQGGMWKVH